ncbi:MAG: hypothetical protein FE041_02425 [Thermoplasmata archaeon]|nr:MAG: hypothetical protein FE041_02425 [Thermoplasmata archaeon]
MSKPIGVRIDSRQEKTWLRFKEFVEEKYGKKHTVLGNELVKALQLYLDLYERVSNSKKEPETQLVKERAGDIELKPLREISYDLLNTLIACRGYLEHIENEIKDVPDSTKDKIDRLKQSLFKAQKLIQERIDSIK